MQTKELNLDNYIVKYVLTNAVTRSVRSCKEIAN